ncbi:MULTISPECIES: GntR family transcriptional regulator [Lachnospiraceae]|nr:MULTISPECIES: GntR family transcriptional regulator [Lachnospiraceae]
MMKQKLDFSGREQLYYQIYDIMFQEIVNGKYAEKDLLPAESELMERYGVSRATVRRAMDLLKDEGLIEKKRGYGTYVKSLVPKSYNRKTVDFVWKHQGEKQELIKKVVSQQVIPADEETAGWLHLEPGVPVIEIVRLWYKKEEPMYLEKSYLDYQWIPEALERDFAKESLRMYYVNRCHVKMAKAEEEIYAVKAGKDEAELLRIREGDAIFFTKRIPSDEQGVHRSFVKSYYRGDCCYLGVKQEL